MAQAIDRGIVQRNYANIAVFLIRRAHVGLLLCFLVVAVYLASLQI
jgi:hypothetical protein